jgi:hypothetical protein
VKKGCASLDLKCSPKGPSVQGIVPTVVLLEGVRTLRCEALRSSECALGQTHYSSHSLLLPSPDVIGFAPPCAPAMTC